MLIAKERKELSAAGQKLQSVFQIGKNGVTDVLIKELSDVLDARELIKISVLNTSGMRAKDIINELCEKLSAEPISAVGGKIVIYRKKTNP